MNSLGVILYELLTGLRPFDAKRLRSAALSEMIRIIQDEGPSKPSTRLSTDESLPSLAALPQIEPRRLMALLRGELDWVVMKCLEKHREWRYETANALVRDIQRYLADEAVESRPPRAGYRVSKFLSRNLGPVLAASVVMLALLLGIFGTTVGMIRADRARADEAKQRSIAAANDAKALVAAEAERKAKEREAEQRAKAEKARDRARQALDAMTRSVIGDSLTT
jgi:eukaryotic-like serine/threonine-protein kinase